VLDEAVLRRVVGGKAVMKAQLERVTEAIKSVDPEASANIDLNGKSARIETKLDPSIISSAITEAGYPSSLKE